MIQTAFIGGLNLLLQVSYTIDDYKREQEVLERKLTVSDAGRDCYYNNSHQSKNDEFIRCFSIEQCENFDLGFKEAIYMASPSMIKDSIMSYSKNSQSIITHLLTNELEIVAKEISFGIERSYQKMLKIKHKASSFNKSRNASYTQETFFFTLNARNNNQIDITDYNSDNDQRPFNYNYTEPNNGLKKTKNLLEEYLPEIKGNEKKGNEDFNMIKSYENDLDLLNEQYEAIKNDLIELNPALKNNSSYREQFFINISEGKEERYVFFKNLYNIINNHPQMNKPVFQIKKLQMKYFKNTNKLQPISNGNKTKAPLPTLHGKLYKEMIDKRKFNRLSALNENHIQMPTILGKSSSGCQLNIKYKTNPLFS